MIKYYDTEAAYAADAKSAFESQVSLVGESNDIKYDGRNVVVGAKGAKTGSIVVLDGHSALHFIALDTFSSSSFMSNYTIVGVVAVGVDHPDFRGKLVVIHKANASKKWSEVYSFKLTGYTLDGTDRTGTLVVRDSSAWGTGVDYVISYNASTVEAFVSQLNTYFQANAPFTTQNWRADADGDGNVTLSFLFVDYRQASNSAKNGFALTANLLPGIPASSGMHRFNGQRSGEGTITNMNRALAYFSADLNNATYNPTSNVTSPVRGYPICKPGYLGTSQYSGGADRCAALRAIYGPGEEGWKNFMRSFLPPLPSKVGVMNKDVYGDGKKNTYLMAGKTFTKQDGTSIVAFPAADYCAKVTYNHELLKSGCWMLPDMEAVFGIMRDVAYPAPTNDRNADKVNRALNAIGGSAIGHSPRVWSSSRYNAYSAWYSSGSVGCAFNNFMYCAYLAVPVTLLDVGEAAS